MLSKISELSIYFAYTHYASSVYELVFHSRSDVAKQTRNPAVARIADRNGCQWSSRSCKVNNCHTIWKGVCDFLLVINIILGLLGLPLSHISAYWPSRSFKVNDLFISFESQYATSC